MATCELKNELERLHKQKRELVNQAKNEMVLSDILSGTEPISVADRELVVSMLGDAVGRKALEAQIANVKGDDISTKIAELKDAIYSNEQLALRMRYLKFSKPDSKFSIIDLSFNNGQIKPEDRSSYLKAKIIQLNQKKMIAQITKMFAQQDRINAELENPALSDTERKSLKNRLNAVENKLNGSALSDAISAIGNISSNDVQFFPALYAVTQTYESKSGDGKPKTKQDREYEASSGYQANKVDKLVIEGNTLDSEHSGSKSSEHNDEVSVLGMMFGVKNGDTIVLPQYVKNSIKMNVLEKMEDIYKMLGYEPFSQEFDDVWGLDKSAESYEQDLQAAQLLHLNGNIPQATILTSLGKAIYKSIPVQFSKELDVEMEQKAVAQLGMYALQYMNNINLIKIGANVSFANGKKNHIMIEANNTSRDDSTIAKASEIMALVSELQFIGATEGRSSARAIGEMHEVSQTIRNSFIETSETVRDNLRAFESTRFKFNDHMETMYQMYINPNGGKDAAYAMAGVLSVDTSKSINDQMKELAKINYAKMQVDAMMETYTRFGTEEFTLPYDYTVSGRYMVNSVFNPQESKISRFLVTSEDLDSTIARGSDGQLDAKDLQVFKVGISQSFDLDPDKTTDTNAMKSLEEIVVIGNDGSVTFKDTIKGKPNPFKTVYDMLQAGRLNGDVDEEVKNAMMAANRKGSGFHGIQAIMALKQLDDASKNKSGDIKLSFSLESDAITSGMILTLMQIGTPKSMALAAKGGVYTKETIAHWQEMHDLYISAGGKGQALKNQDGTFKLTHGWLKEFSKDFKRIVELGDKGEFLYSASNSKMRVEADAYLASGYTLNEFFVSKAEFSDIYETVANTANKEMQKMKGQLDDNIAEYEEALTKLSGDQFKVVENAITEMKLQQSMIDMVGAVKRSLAKPSVMVYIYGAMIDSIKKKMVDAIVMPKIYDVLLSPTFAEMSYSNFKATLDMFRSDPSLLDKAEPQFKGTMQLIMHMMDGNETVEFKKLDGNTFVKDNAQLMKNIIISEKTSKRLSKIVNGTLGTAFEKGFSEFGEIDAYRDSVKSAEVVRFAMFKYQLNKGLNKIVKRLKGDATYKIGSRDIASVINELEHNGFGHSVNDINGGKQPLYKKDALEKEMRTMLDLKVKLLSPKSASLEGKEFAPNTGASGVITIHNIDGYIDSVSAKMYDLIRIYDGSVSGINQLNPSVRDYNAVVLETTRWNSYNQQVKDLAKQISKMEESGEMSSMMSSLTNSDKEMLLNTIEKLMGYDDISDDKFDINRLIKRNKEAVKDRVKSNSDFRKDGETELSIMHSYLSDIADPYVAKMHSGSEVSVEPHVIDSIYGAYRNILTNLQAYKLSKTIVPGNGELKASGSEETVKIDSSEYQVSNKQEMVEAIIAANKGTNADKHTNKELVKAAIATQYIGFGSKGSSTDRYRTVYGNSANSGVYSSDDVVWVSSNGKRNGRVNPVDYNGELIGGYKIIDKAMSAGSTIVMDTVAHLRQTKTYNIGEMQLGKYLASHGYARVGKTGEWKPKDSNVESVSKNDPSQTDGANKEADMQYSEIKKAFIESMKGIIPPKEASKIADEIIGDCK